MSVKDLLLSGAQRLLFVSQQLANDAGFGFMEVVVEKVTKTRFLLVIGQILRGLRPRFGHESSPVNAAVSVGGGGSTSRLSLRRLAAAIGKNVNEK